MLKLLILSSSYPCSDEDGTCGYVREFARSLSSDFMVTVLAPPDPQANDGERADFVLQRSKPLLPATFDPVRASADLNSLAHARFSVRLRAMPSLLAFAVTAFGLARRADVICAHWIIPSGLIGACIARLLGKPLVVVEHSGALQLLRRLRTGGIVARFVVSSSYRIVTVSGDLKHKLIDLCPEAASKTDVVPMGVWCDRAGSSIRLVTERLKTNFGHGHLRELRRDNRNWSEENGASKILFVGRLTRVKGLEVLLQAMRELQGAELLIAGDGEERPNLEKLATRLNARARFLGAVRPDEKLDLLNECDVLVVPSVVLPGDRTEGLPVVCLEGMAAGKPVVASPVGGMAEIMEDGYNGLLFEPGDSRMLARQLARLAADQDLRARLGENARRVAATFDWSKIGLQFSEILKRATSNFAARRSGVRNA